MTHLASPHAAIGADRLVTDIATDLPATIAVFQRHRLGFCCDGKVPLRIACDRLGLSLDAVVQELSRAVEPAPPPRDWAGVGLAAIVEYVRGHQHVLLRAELPRLHAMLTRVVSRHGDRHGERLYPLRGAFDALQRAVLAHVGAADTTLFPLIEAIDADPSDSRRSDRRIRSTVQHFEDAHAACTGPLAEIRALTDDFVPPAWACPTFRGLYHGLGQLDVTLHDHRALARDVLIPRLWALTRG